MKWGSWGKKLTTYEMSRLIETYFEQGINTFDHADIYGAYSTEAAFGSAFSTLNIDRKEVRFISKCGIQLVNESRGVNRKHYDYSAQYIRQQVEQSLNNLQTEYLDVLLKRGVVGLMLLLLLYLGPMFCFFKSHLEAADVDVKSLAMAGMVIPMMYMDFGLTQLFLGHNSGRMVLVSLWMCVAALLLNAVEDNKQYDVT